VISRIIASEIAQSENWRLVVENKPGALQGVAMRDVLSHPADALSVFAMGVGAVATAALVPDRGIRIDTDFAPVVEIASGPLVLVVHPSMPAASINELVSVLKRTPAQYSFGSGGLGTPAHLAVEMFRQVAAVNPVHVPYPQPQQRLADLLSGRTQASFDRGDVADARAGSR
jgi:tripartite-type tricarboxylate transporter receptor subunit TctC